MAYATAQDIEARLGRSLDASEAQIVTIRLGDAERLLKARIRDLAEQLAAGTLDVDTVIMIEADAVIRLIRNPEGFTSETDGNYTYMVDARVASGRLQILDDEWSLLGVRRSVFSLAPKVTMPWDRTPVHPESCFGPQIPDPNSPYHPAVWWGED